MDGNRERSPDRKGLLPYLAFILKWFDTCCEFLKLVKFRPEGIVNPTKGVNDVEVNSKEDGKWQVKYHVSDSRVGSLSENLDTVCNHEAKNVAKEFYDEIQSCTTRSSTRIKYLNLDCDTLHSIDDVNVVQKSDDQMQPSDGGKKCNKGKVDRNAMYSSLDDVADDQTSRKVTDGSEHEENNRGEVDRDAMYLVDDAADDQTSRKLTDDSAFDTGSEEDETKMSRRGRMPTEPDAKENVGVCNLPEKAEIGVGRNDVVSGDVGTQTTTDDCENKIGAGELNSKIDSTCNSVKDELFKTFASNVMYSQQDSPDAKRNKSFEVVAVTSKNNGYCTLKINTVKPITEHTDQLLNIFKSDEGRILKRPKPSIVKDLATFVVKSFDLSCDVFIKVKEPVYKIMMFVSQTQSGNASSYAEGDTVFAVGLDWVPCLRMPQWPKEAEGWITRERKSLWPSKDIIHEIVLRGCHVVPKAHPDNLQDETEWLYSFSEAELELSKHLTNMQKKCFRMFKLIVQLHCQVLIKGKMDYPSSYSLKTLFFWACEEITPETWDKDLGACFLALFKRLEDCLENNTINGYFITEMNLIDHKGKDWIQAILSCVREITRDPIKFLEDTWNRVAEPELGWAFDRVFGELIKCSNDNQEEVDFAISRSCLNLALMLNDYVSQEVTRSTLKEMLADKIYGSSKQMSATGDIKMIRNGEEEEPVVAQNLSGMKVIKELLEDSLTSVSKHEAIPKVRFGILVQEYVLWGKVNYINGKLLEAKENFEMAIQILSSDGCKVSPKTMSSVRTDYGKCLASLQPSSPDMVLNEFQNALALDPNNQVAQIYKIMYLDKIGRKEDVEKLIKNGHDTAETSQDDTKAFQPKLFFIQACRGDLPILDHALRVKVEAVLDLRLQFPRTAPGVTTDALSVIFVPTQVITSYLYLKRQDITKTTLNNEFRSYVDVMTAAGDMARADCKYIAKSLLASLNEKADSY